MTRDIKNDAAPLRSLPRLAGLGFVGTGLGVLALIAAQGLLTQTREEAALPAPQPALAAAAPTVWLAAFDLRETPFAAPDLTPEGELFRRQTPHLASRPAPSAPAPAAEAEPAAIAEAPVPSPALESETPQVEVRAHAPRSVPPRRPFNAPAIAALPQTDEPVTELASLTDAPTRSPLPRPRPETALAAPVAAALAPVGAPALLASLGDSTGLLRSRTPQARPETVTRLASLALTPPAAASTPAIEVPALSAAIARGGDSCDSQMTRAIPGRSRSATDGSSVINRLTGAGGRERDDAIIAEILSGNLPDFQRQLVPVTFNGQTATGAATRITICVTPDYLAVGSNRDFVRVPLGLPAAMRVAERFDMVLPTTRMVDAIYRQAQVQLSPAPMDPTSAMVTTGYFLRHNATVQGQMARAGGQLGQLVSGHKKDLVLSNRLQSNPGRVAIYGWHQRNGQAIQPLSTVHGAQYADYSHGVRLVARRAFVNGRAVDLRDLLSDDRLAGMLSSEGTITHRQLLAMAE